VALFAAQIRRAERFGGSMATTAMSWSKWLWIMSRMAPTPS
jgi:hypothetical protein